MKKRSLIIVLVLVVLAILVFGYFKYIKKPELAPVQEASLEEVVYKIDGAFKSILLLTSDGQVDQIADIAPQSLRAWEDFVRAFKDNQPEVYSRTRDWGKKLFEILEHQRKADELFKEGKKNEAQAELEASRLMFKEIKEENNIFDISEEMLSFYDEIKKVSYAGTKKEVLKSIDSLKLRFTILKEFGVDEEYIQLMDRLEKAIATLDKSLDGSDFKKAQSELIPTFMEVYKEY